MVVHLTIEQCYNRIMKSCKYCGTEFTPSKYRISKFCSHSCYTNSRWKPSERKFTKIDGVWYKGECNTCKKLITSQYAKECHDCRWRDNRNPVVISGKPIKHYHKAHWWISKNYGKPSKCEKCGIIHKNHRRFNWANISGEYRLNRKDWLRLCVKCHVFMDRKEVRDDSFSNL